MGSLGHVAFESYGDEGDEIDDVPPDPRGAQPKQASFVLVAVVLASLCWLVGLGAARMWRRWHGNKRYTSVAADERWAPPKRSRKPAGRRREGGRAAMGQRGARRERADVSDVSRDVEAGLPARSKRPARESGGYADAAEARRAAATRAERQKRAEGIRKALAQIIAPAAAAPAECAAPLAVMAGDAGTSKGEQGSDGEEERDASIAGFFPAGAEDQDEASVVAPTVMMAPPQPDVGPHAAPTPQREPARAAREAWPSRREPARRAASEPGQEPARWAAELPAGPTAEVVPAEVVPVEVVPVEVVPAELPADHPASVQIRRLEEKMSALLRRIEEVQAMGPAAGQAGRHAEVAAAAGQRAAAAAAAETEAERAAAEVAEPAAGPDDAAEAPAGHADQTAEAGFAPPEGALEATAVPACDADSAAGSSAASSTVSSMRSAPLGPRATGAAGGGGRFRWEDAEIVAEDGWGRGDEHASTAGSDFSMAHHAMMTGSAQRMEARRRHDDERRASLARWDG